MLRLGRVEEAIQLTEEGFENMGKAFGANHQRTVEEYLRFGTELSRIHEFDRAVKYLQIYIDRRLLVVSPSDELILNAKMMIGSIRNDQGKLEEAIQYFE